VQLLHGLLHQLAKLNYCSRASAANRDKLQKVKNKMAMVARALLTDKISPQFWPSYIVLYSSSTSSTKLKQLHTKLVPPIMAVPIFWN